MTTTSANVPASETDIHHFDELHRLLLRYIQEDKGSLVLLMLSVPSLYESALFWKTCTYHEGIAAAVLGQLITRRAQAGIAEPHLIAFPSPVQMNEEESGKKAGSRSPSKRSSRNKSHSEKTNNTKGKGDMIQQSEGIVEDTTGVTLAEVYVLLQRCLAEPTLRHTTSDAASEEIANNEKDSVLENFMHALRRGLDMAEESKQQSGTAALTDRTTNNTATTSKQRDIDVSTPRRFDLAALSAILRERCYNMLYVNPLDPTPPNTNTTEGRCENVKGTTHEKAQGKENTQRSSPPQPTQETYKGEEPQVNTTTTTTTTAAQHKRPRSSTPASQSSSQTATDDEETVADEQPAPQQEQQEQEKETDSTNNTTKAPAASLAEQALSQYAPPRTTAVEVLQAVAPVPGTVTRIATSFDAIVNDKEAGAEEVSTTEMEEAVTEEAGKDVNDKDTRSELHRESPVEEARAALTQLAQRHPIHHEKTSEQRKQPAVQNDTKQQTDPEAARVAAAIRAFDVFNRADENKEGIANITTSGNNTSKVAVNALPLRYTHGNNTSASNNHREQGSSNGSNPLGIHADPVPRTAHRIIRRRVHFTEAEDAAIVQGVARYGQSPSRFKFIFEAFREVWLPGRTAMKLYDHWRDALRRKTMTECRPGHSGSDEEEEGGDAEERRGKKDNE